MKEDIKYLLEEFESLFETSEAPEHIIKDFNKIKDYITNLQKGIKSVIWQIEHNIRPQSLLRDKYLITQLNNILKGEKK